MKFTTKIFLPILKKDIRIEPISNRYFFDLIKYITNNDDEGINDYLEYVINEIVVDKENINNISNLEKFLILLNSKSFSSGNKIQIMGTNQVKSEVSLSSIYKNILLKTEGIDFSDKIVSDNIEIKLSLPKKLKIDNVDDIYKEVINEVKIDNECVKFYLLTDKEKDDIINSIPVLIINDILEYIKKIQNIFSKIYIISGGENKGFDDIKLNVFDNTIFYFVKSLFNDNLKNFYELQYVIINKILLSYEHFLSLTPNDCKMFINLYNEDIKKQQEEQKNSQSATPSLPSMPRIPSMPK
jgi:hypothetical protein